MHRLGTKVPPGGAKAPCNFVLIIRRCDVSTPSGGIYGHTAGRDKGMDDLFVWDRAPFDQPLVGTIASTGV